MTISIRDYGGAQVDTHSQTVGGEEVPGVRIPELLVGAPAGIATISSQNTNLVAFSSQVVSPHHPVWISLDPEAAGYVVVSRTSGNPLKKLAPGDSWPVPNVTNLDQLSYQFTIGSGAPETLYVQFNTAS